MGYKYRFLLPALLLVHSFGLWSQTAIDLKSQSRNIDFSGASSTRPFKTGTVLPAACAVGESFFKSNATAGQNLYGCVAANTWVLMSASLNNTGVTAGTYGAATQVPVLTVDAAGRITSASQVAVQGGGGGSGNLPGATGHAGKYLTNDGTNAFWQRVGSSDLGDCAPSITGGVLSIAACSARNGTLDVNISQCTASLTGTSSSGTVYGYLSVDGAFTLGHSAAATLVCGSWNAVTSVSSFPADALPLFVATFSANAWNTAGITNYRRLIARDPIVAGTGLQAINNDSTGVTTLQVDAALIPRYFTGTGAPGLNCTQGRDFYLDTGAATLYQCTATNTWNGLGGSGATITARRYPVWGLLTNNGGNSTGAFAPNETRWQQFHLPVAMTVSGVGLRAWTGLGSSKGMRFAIANTSGTILYKTNVQTTCATSSQCEASLPSSVTLPAGVYYLGLTTDSTTLQTGQLAAMLDGTPICAQSNAGTDPKIAGSGAAGSGTAASVDFAGSMGTLTTYTCNGGSNNLVVKFHDMYLF